jgi:hypothetical protein
MRVTQTWREVVSLLPRFRIVALSLERLQVRSARITVVTLAMVHLQPVVMLEAPPTATPTSVLLFEPPGQSCADVGVSALARAPVDPVPILGTAVALALHLPGHGPLAVGQQGRGLEGGGRGGQGETGADAMPGPLDGPGGGWPRGSPACPVAELAPGEVREPCVDGMAYRAAVVGGPSPPGGVRWRLSGPCGRAVPRLRRRPSAASWACPVPLAGWLRVVPPRRPWPPGPVPAWAVLTRDGRLSHPSNSHPG